ncbi:MAG: hypothetical protein SGILL_006470 [Bacillariaceae sp.]
MTLFGIKVKRGGGGSVKDGVEANHDNNNPEDKLYSSARQLPVACPEPEEVERAMFRRRINRPRIPLVIKCGQGASPPSSPTVQKKKSPLNFRRDRQSPSDDNDDPKYECLRLLESELYEDNRLGIEHLVIIVNRELVNSKTEGSVAEALIYPSKEEDDDFAKRIRAVFPTFFTNGFLFKSFRQNKKSISNNKNAKDSETQESGSTDETSFYSDLSNSTGKRYRRSMKLPALRVFVSSMELLSRKRNMPPLDAEDPFWKCMLAYMVDSLKAMHLERVESSLCVKGLRLLHKLDPSMLESKASDSVVSLMQGAKEHGKLDGDKMLVRECDRFLKVHKCLCQ